MIREEEIKMLEKMLKEDSNGILLIARSFLENVVTEFKDSKKKINTAFEEGKKVGVEETLTWSKSNVENSYNEGLNDAWKLVKRAYKFTENARMKIFGCTMLSLLESMTPQEALAKLEAYEAEKTIKQWDVVEYGCNNTKILVTEIAGETFSGIKITPTNEFGKFGAVYSARNLTDCKKTNYKADLSAILAEIGKE